MVSEDALIILRRSQISVWKFPALSNQQPHFIGDPPLFSPDLEIPYPVTIFDVDDLYDCVGPCDWYSGTNQPLIRDLIHPPDGDYNYSQLIRFEVIFDGFRDTEILALRTLPMPNFPVFYPYRCSQDTLTTWWYDGTYISAQISSIKGLPMPDKVANILLFATDVESGIKFSSFCPSSGRLVCLDDEQNIHVIDFLTPTPR